MNHPFNPNPPAGASSNGGASVPASRSIVEGGASVPASRSTVDSATSLIPSRKDLASPHATQCIRSFSLGPFSTAFLLALFVMAAISLSRAFTPAGPFPNTSSNAWQTVALGYQRPGDIACPMNLGEEYRWNQPTITYAYDQSFLNYFGQQGVQAVEAAIKILNNLPYCSNMTSELTEYPTDNKRANYTAAALGIQDLKSTTLSILLEVIGLTTPERWVYALRAKDTYNSGGTTYSNYLVIMRNFDPVTYQPTNRVNAFFYSYYIRDPIAPQNYADAVEIYNDAVGLLPYSAVAGNPPDPGYVYTGLTRDDVGGLRYLLRYKNYNVEQLPVGITLYTNLATNGLFWITNSPWSIYTGTLTNGSNNSSSFLTNIFLGSNLAPWNIYLVQTNVATNGTNIVGTNNMVQAALRPGLEKIKFVRANFDSLLGQTFTPITNVYYDYYLSNYVRYSQRVQRITLTPDILFAAYDLGVRGAGSVFPVMARRNVNYINNDAINGLGTPHAGPGNLSGPLVIGFTDILPGFVNDSGINGLDMGYTNAMRTMIWGSFAPTMDVPITIYPNWISLSELEALVETQ